MTCVFTRRVLCRKSCFLKWVWNPVGFKIRKETADSHPVPPKTNMVHLKMMVSNRNLLFQGFIFR